jgi:hypothetical protein
MSLVTLLLIVLIVLLIVGVSGHGRWGYWGYSPVMVILIVLLILILTGHLEAQTLQWAGEEPPPPDPGPLSPGVEALTLGGALTTLIVGVTQLAKWALTRRGRPSWWGQWAPRVIAVAQGLVWAVALIPSQEWRLVTMAALSGVVAVFAYDFMAATDSASTGHGGASIGVLLLACLLAGTLATSSGCGGMETPVTYDGIAGELKIDTTEGSQSYIRGSVRNYVTLWGVPVELEVAYYRGAVAGCIKVGLLPTVCAKRPVGGGLVLGGAGP